MASLFHIRTNWTSPSTPHAEASSAAGPTPLSRSAIIKRLTVRFLIQDERSECEPDRAKQSSNARSECEPDRAKQSSNARSECEPDRAKQSSNERSECEPDRAKQSSNA